MSFKIQLAIFSIIQLKKINHPRVITNFAISSLRNDHLDPVIKRIFTRMWTTQGANKRNHRIYRSV